MYFANAYLIATAPVEGNITGGVGVAADAGLRVVKDGAGIAFDAETTWPVGARPVKFGFAGAIEGGLGPPGSGIGIGICCCDGGGICCCDGGGICCRDGVICARRSTHVPFIQLNPSGQGGRRPQLPPLLLGVATSPTKPSHALHVLR